MNIAVVDLGTNTFNCCVVSLCGHSFTTLLEFHEYPRLGENGVAHGYIADDAMERGMQSLGVIYEKIKPYNCEKVSLIGTSTLRNANNADVFCRRAKELYNFDITIIQGEQEAELIFLGNNLAYNWGDKTALILDIGGGSNECIICNQDKILWKHSFECGMQRIVSKFGLSHPIPQQTKIGIQQYLEEKFALLTKVVQNYSIDVMIGSAGAFDVFRSIHFAQLDQQNPDAVASEIPLDSFQSIIQYITSNPLDEIESMKGMSIPRAPLLPIAGLIANFVLTKYRIPQLVQSSYSLKEGVIHTLM